MDMAPRSLLPMTPKQILEAAARIVEQHPALKQEAPYREVLSKDLRRLAASVPLSGGPETVGSRATKDEDPSCRAPADACEGGRSQGTSVAPTYSSFAPLVGLRADSSESAIAISGNALSSECQRLQVRDS